MANSVRTPIGMPFPESQRPQATANFPMYPAAKQDLDAWLKDIASMVPKSLTYLPFVTAAWAHQDHICRGFLVEIGDDWLETRNRMTYAAGAIVQDFWSEMNFHLAVSGGPLIYEEIWPFSATLVNKGGAVSIGMAGRFILPGQAPTAAPTISTTNMCGVPTTQDDTIASGPVEADAPVKIKWREFI